MSRDEVLIEYLAQVIRHSSRAPSEAIGLRRVRFVYRAADPYAVTLLVSNGGHDWATWTFAREVLASGLDRGTGLGEVHVCPAPHEPGDKVAIIVRPRPGTGYELLLRRAEVETLLARTRSLVPVEDESAWIDWTRELAFLHGGELR